jgi:LmbE family N-acetylglucosaminyl deacetylase
LFITGLLTIFTLLIAGSGPGGRPVTRYPIVAAAGPRDRVLIVAPHIDDEVIGAGGYAGDAIRNGAQVYVVFLTAGDCNRFSASILHRTLEPTANNYLEVGRTRIIEARAAMARLGVAPDHYFILGYPDGGLRAIFENPTTIVRSRSTGERSVPYSDALSPGSPYSMEHLASDLRRVVDLAAPTVVVAPVPFDMHPDHSAAADMTDMVLADSHRTPKRLGYLIHTSRIPKSFVWFPERSLAPPPRFENYAWATYPLTPRMQKEKDAVLLLYKSQRPYVFLLRNAYIRKNELFLAEIGDQKAEVRKDKAESGRQKAEIESKALLTF